MTICPPKFNDLSNTISYKGFTGIINYCNQDNILYGCVIAGVPESHSISYHGNTIEECINDFHEAIDFYLLPDVDEDSGMKSKSLSA